MKGILLNLVGNYLSSGEVVVESPARLAQINEAQEEDYWRRYYKFEGYVNRRRHFRDYQAAYKVGYVAFGRYAHLGIAFDSVEPEMKEEYDRLKGQSTLDWPQAKRAARAAWDKLV